MLLYTWMALFILVPVILLKDTLLSTVGTIEFMGQVTHFLGIEFTWKHHHDEHMSVSLIQQCFAETLIDSLGFVSALVFLLLLHHIYLVYQLIL
jgi:hypothetical protein